MNFVLYADGSYYKASLDYMRLCQDVLHYAVVFGVEETGADAVVVVVYQHAVIGEIAEFRFVLFRKSFLTEYEHTPYLFPDDKFFHELFVMFEFLVLLGEPQRLGDAEQGFHAAFDVAEQHAGVVDQRGVLFRRERPSVGVIFLYEGLHRGGVESIFLLVAFRA